MAYNPGLYYPQPYQPYTIYQPAQPQPQAMSYPTIHADIIQTDDEGVIERWAVEPGRPQMFTNTMETMITVKSVTGAGITIDRYDKRPPAPPAPVFDPADYITRAELEERLAALGAPRKAKKEETSNEPV